MILWVHECWLFFNTLFWFVIDLLLPVEMLSFVLGVWVMFESVPHFSCFLAHCGIAGFWYNEIAIKWCVLSLTYHSKWTRSDLFIDLFCRVVTASFCASLNWNMFEFLNLKSMKSPCFCLYLLGFSYCLSYGLKVLGNQAS